MLASAYDEPFESISAHIDLKSLLCRAQLDSRTQAILLRRYMRECSYKEIGARHGISAERVRQIINKGIACLQEHASRGTGEVRLTSAERWSLAGWRDDYEWLERLEKLERSFDPGEPLVHGSRRRTRYAWAFWPHWRTGDFSVPHYLLVASAPMTAVALLRDHITPEPLTSLRGRVRVLNRSQAAAHQVWWKNRYVSFLDVLTQKQRTISWFNAWHYRVVGPDLLTASA